MCGDLQNQGVNFPMVDLAIVMDEGGVMHQLTENEGTL